MYENLIGELYLAAGEVKSSARKRLLEKAADAIRRLSAADVRPVECGEWQWETYTEKGMREVLTRFTCNRCGAGGFEWKYNFCPNCGADMREE